MSSQPPSPLPPYLGQTSSWHIGIAAEACAAALFARCGCDVSVQYGANQPEYDLIIARNNRMVKVSVKGSQDGSWGLTQTELTRIARQIGRKADYHGAIDMWLRRHGARTIFCLVQFKGVPFDQMPRVYLATPAEIGTRLKETAGGRGDSILYEHHAWTVRASGAGIIEQIPPSWRFIPERIEHLLISVGGEG